jgi:hypothetical protein
MVTTSSKQVQDDGGLASGHDASAAAPVEQVMELLEERVPLSLLMDLVAPTGPDSQDILETEGAPEQAWWERH